jgi:hypothetical protein
MLTLTIDESSQVNRVIIDMTVDHLFVQCIIRIRSMNSFFENLSNRKRIDRLIEYAIDHRYRLIIK